MSEKQITHYLGDNCAGGHTANPTETAGQESETMDVERDAVYWKERHDIERGEVEIKDAELARLVGANEQLEIALGQADERFRNAAAAQIELQAALQQAHAERDALGHDLEVARTVATVNGDAIAAMTPALQQAYDHVNELREAWERGVMREGDGSGGLRSNRNVDVLRALREALASMAPAETP